MDVVQQLVEEAPSRVNEVKSQITAILSQSEDSFMQLCDLLYETLANKYHQYWGYSRFQDWVATSNLDLSVRQAFYCVNIAKKLKDLEIDPHLVKEVKVSKIKEILSLEPMEHDAEMKQLFEEARYLPLEEVKKRVAELKGKQAAVYMTLKLDQSVKEIIQMAFDEARQRYGSMETEGEATDISDSRCMELICAAYLQEPQTFESGRPDEVRD